MNDYKSYIEKLLLSYPQLNCCKNSIEQALDLLINVYKYNGKLLTCGNGGSAADAEHIVGELMKGFLLQRKLPVILKDKIKEENIDGEFIANKLQGTLEAISLVSQTALITASANDQSSYLVFAQQVLGYGKKNDALLCISTSGNSKNVIYAAQVAKKLGMKVIGLSGRTGGKLNVCADVNIIAPEKDTYKIQELHLPIYHALCAALEEKFYGGEK